MAAKDRPNTINAARLWLGPDAVYRLNKGLCPLCGVKPEKFRDQLSVEEFKISGLCQPCQDGVFKDE